MSTIHSIQVSDGNGSTYTATRTSKTREYAACVVRTVTEASIAIDLANHAKAEADIAEHTATLDARKAQFNLNGLITHPQSVRMTCCAHIVQCECEPSNPQSEGVVRFS